MNDANEEPANNSMQLPVLRAAADAGRSPAISGCVRIRATRKELVECRSEYTATT